MRGLFRRNKAFLGSVVLLSLCTGVLYAVPPVVLRSGHSAAVLAMHWHAEEQLLFSAGADGKLKVWHPESNRIVQSLRVSRNAIRRIALYPDGERIALLAGDTRRNYRISVWNWRTGERLFLHSPEDDVLWMEVSPQGSYLMYSTPDLRSMRILDAGTGRQLPFLRQNTGIVSWFVPAASEERVMVYNPSNGRIEYRSVVTGSVAATFEAPPSLEELVLLEQRRFAAGRSSTGMLVVVDLLSGAVVASTAAGEIESIRRDTGSPDIVVVSRAFGGARSIRRYRFENGSLQQRFVPRRDIPDTAGTLLVADRELFAADQQGTILRWNSFAATPVQFATDMVQRVSDIFFTNNQLQLLTADQLITITSDFLDDLTFINQRTTAVDLHPRSRFLIAGPQDVMVWNPGGGAAALLNYTTFSSRLTPALYSIPEGTMAVQTTATEVLLLTRGGDVRLLDRASGNQIFTYRAPGAQAVLRTSRDVFIGKSFAGGFLDSSILRIDPRSGQTVPMDSDAELVFALHQDARRGRLFSLGIRDGQGPMPVTILEVHEGVNYQRRRVILEVPGEYLDAHLVVDESTGSVYTTLDDRGGTLRWDGIRVSELDRNAAHIPRRLFLAQQHLFTVNWDGTVSVLDRHDGTVLTDIMVLGNRGPGAWVAVRPDGGVYVSRQQLATPQVLTVNLPGRELSDFLFRPENFPAPRQQPAAPSPHSPGSRFDDFRRPDPPAPFDPRSGEPAPSS